MIDHKTVLNRDAKAEIQLKIAGITDERKAELMKEYYDPDKCLKNPNSQKVLIGNWLNNATSMLLKGATEEELNRVVEHIVVLLHAVKCQLNVQKSYKDRDLLGLTRKYFAFYKKVKTKDGDVIVLPESVVERRKQIVDDATTGRAYLEKKARKMKESGCTDECIAEELTVPLSTVRVMLKKQ